MRELYLRSCGLREISPLAFSGLENYLEVLDLSGNQITQLPDELFHRLELLKTLSLRDNALLKIDAAQLLNGFQFSLYKLDLSGSENGVVSIQHLRRWFAPKNNNLAEFLSLQVEKLARFVAVETRPTDSLS
jgi:Leucine-rich repeat (LRR) protein